MVMSSRLRDEPLLRSKTARVQLIAFQLRLHSFLTSTIPQGRIFSNCIFQGTGQEEEDKERAVVGRKWLFIFIIT